MNFIQGNTVHCLIIIMIKTSATGRRKKKKQLLQIAFTITYTTQNWRKTQLGDTTNGWLLPYTHPTFRCQTV